MRRRDLAIRAWHDHAYDRYKELQNKAQRLVQTAKNAYYIDVFNRACSAKEVWNKMRHLGLVKGTPVLASCIRWSSSTSSLRTVKDSAILRSVILSRTFSQRFQGRSSLEIRYATKNRKNNCQD